MKEWEEEKAKRTRIEYTRRHNERVLEAMIPKLWKETTFDNSDPSINRMAFSHCLTYAQTFNPATSKSLYLFSRNNGTGKTHLAVCIANYVVRERACRVRFQKARDLMLDIRKTYSDQGTESEAGIYNKVLGYDLLILDDVGVDRPSEWLWATYWTVVDRRMEAGLPMVVTANYSLNIPEKDVCLSDRIGPGAVSRLRQICGDNVYEFKGKDLR